MPNYQISKQSVSAKLLSFTKEKAIPFIKQGSLIPFIFSTLLYILMRVFFIGSEFDLRESVELYVKTFFVTWTYINAFRLICYGIIWIESRSAKVTLAKVISMPALKKTAILLFIAGLTYSVKARSGNKTIQKPNKENIANSETAADVDPKFYFWTK